ncbi:MAG: hypothetical protein QOE87_824 [Gaiellales bacterium]|nr:hypothetical protein [Gaiellales bacterium]
MGMPARGRRGALALTVAALVCTFSATATAASSDRAIKACLLTRTHPAPRLVVYGSSRAAKLEPSYVGSLLGETAFNASVSSGTPEVAWAFAHLEHDQAGSAPARALWLLDLESLRPGHFDASLLPVPALARSFTALGGAVLPAPETIHGPFSGTCSFKTNPSTHYTSDGFRARDFHDAAAAGGFTLRQGLRSAIAHYEQIYGKGYPRISPERVAWVARTIRAFNSWGIRPVIVLTPAHPAFRRALGPLGWDLRHAQVLKTLRNLRMRFTLLDASSISTFGGRPGDFYDGVHMRVANMRRLAAWIVRQARRDLTAP